MDLYINEIFASVQGEGVHTGLLTTFIRLAGCDLRCTWCDTPYSLTIEDGSPIPVEKVVMDVIAFGTSIVCITGGEPLMQKETVFLVERLLKEGFETDIETNGAHDVSTLPLKKKGLFLSVDVKTPSSGESGSFLLRNLEHLRKDDQLKFIIKDGSDLDFALAFLQTHLPSCNIILTPCSNEGGKVIVERLISLSREERDGPFRNVSNRIRVMIQTHKVLWPLDERGV